MRAELGSPGVDSSVTGDQPAHNCGLFAEIDFAGENVAYDVTKGLVRLQHRGQAGAGLATVSGTGAFFLEKAPGKVVDVFGPGFPFNKFPGSVAIAHNRYGTSGPQGKDALQPFLFPTVVGDRKAMFAFAHNGNIPEEVTDRMLYELEPDTQLLAGTDSEILGARIQQTPGRTWGEKVEKALADIRGGFCILIATDDGGLIAARDTQGMRPLVRGEFSYAGELNGYAVSSETAAFDEVGGVRDVQDIEPGEIVWMRRNKKVNKRSFAVPEIRAGCPLEEAYIADSTSTLAVVPGEARVSVAERRREIGRELALEIPEDHPMRSADMVIGVPASAIPTAEGLAEMLDMPAVEAITKVKNTRSFMGATHEERVRLAREKFAVSAEAVAGKRLLVVDDTMVRGGTFRELISKLRAAGAREVHAVAAAPSIVKKCEWGVHIDPETQQLAALDENGRQKTLEEMAADVGADSMYHMSVWGFTKALGPERHCTHCFNGEHPTTGESGPVPVTLFRRPDQREPVFV